MALNVFIGSSGEAREELDTIAEWIEYHGHVPRPWTDHTLFPLAKTTFDSLHQAARQVDAALFLFSEDDNAWYRGNNIDLPRDNVLLEYGLFSGSLGDGAVAIATLGKPKMPSDLGGVTYLPLKQKAMAKNKLKLWLDGIEKKTEISNKIERLSLPFQSAGKRSLFEQGTKLIREASFRVALVAKTPILAVGTRPYGKPGHAISYEKEQLEIYHSLAEDASNGGQLEFRCVGSIPSLKSDILEVSSEEFSNLISTNIKKYNSMSFRNDSRFMFQWCEYGSLMTYVVSDNKFLMWFKDAGGENVWITAESEEIAGALWDQSGKISDRYDDSKMDQIIGPAS